MSAKWIGIGIVVATAAVGGYVALRQPASAPAPLAAAPPPSAPTVAPPVVAEAEETKEVRPSEPPARPSQTTRREAATSVPVQKGTATVPAPTPVAPPTPPPAAPPVSTEPPVQVEPQRYVPDPPPATTTPSTPEPTFDEVIVAKASVIGITLEQMLSTRTARVEDRVSGRVSRDVRVAGTIAIPEGSRLEGTVVVVEHGGKFRDRPRIGIRFSTVVLPDNTRIALSTDPIYREGESPAADATAKVGTGAVIGAVLGAVLGGKKGAILGGSAGAAGGAAAVARGEEPEVLLKTGTSLTVRLIEDLAVLIRR